MHRGGFSAAFWAIELVAVQLLGPLGVVKGVWHVVGEMRFLIQKAVSILYSHAFWELRTQNSELQTNCQLLRFHLQRWRHCFSHFVHLCLDNSPLTRWAPTLMGWGNLWTLIATKNIGGNGGEYQSQSDLSQLLLCAPFQGTSGSA